ncbi:Ubiquinone/menaquinone biosynthesis C-methyltransferase UbiE [Pseudocercospora fuligena]|uniref:Ubiquinone/menaquinone biosynthesis C-methyltransferase UbiE n=1 Tax=Pseudocercospora fuligena TaxID=685502 RepID=A0A8H6RNZ3_9PEZI|nr:Ubiquinone/menaquinone biosynthesis C-methyltransferase UbiE [Pseudocercospora fuligena]
MEGGSTRRLPHSPTPADGEHETYLDFTQDNLVAWDNIAEAWEQEQSRDPVLGGKVNDGNDMYQQCLLPVVDELANWRPGESVLDLGAGTGIIARLFARKGAHVTGLDFSEKMLTKGRESVKAKGFEGSVEYGYIDLMNQQNMAEYMLGRENAPHEGKFDLITISTTLKSLPDLTPISEALPSMLKPGGRIVIVDLHPAFSKPAGHRGIEILEDPATGKQQQNNYIKVPKYLDIPPSRSEAVRGQPEPIWLFHRPFHALLEPFFKNDLMLDAMREPAFRGEPRDLPVGQANHNISYHNFTQTPMLLAFRLVHRSSPGERL